MKNYENVRLTPHHRTRREIVCVCAREREAMRVVVVTSVVGERETAKTAKMTFFERSNGRLPEICSR